MNTSKYLVLIFASVVEFISLIYLTLLLIKNLKKQSEIEGKIVLSYSIWLSMILVAASILEMQTIKVLSESLDNIYKVDSANAVNSSLQISGLLIGVSVLWFTACFFISKYLSIIFIGSRKDDIEIEDNNYSYFLLRGVMLISVTLILLNSLESILRLFIPSLFIPFYH